MKLLLDENLSRRIVPFLQGDFPGSTQVALLEMESASDRELWQHPADNGYAIVTKDADFQEKSLLLGAPPKVILLRIGNSTKSAITTKLLANSRSILEALSSDEVDCLILE